MGAGKQWTETHARPTHRRADRGSTFKAAAVVTVPGRGRFGAGRCSAVAVMSCAAGCSMLTGPESSVATTRNEKHEESPSQWCTAGGWRQPMARTPCATFERIQHGRGGRRRVVGRRRYITAGGSPASALYHCHHRLRGLARVPHNTSRAAMCTAHADSHGSEDSTAARHSSFAQPGLRAGMWAAMPSRASTAATNACRRG